MTALGSGAGAPALENGSLTREQVQEMEALLIAGFREETFQRRLCSAWKTGTHRASKRAACRDLCLEVQGPVAHHFGFEASHEGVARLELAAQRAGRTQEMWSSEAVLEWLLDPDLQAESGVRSRQDLLLKGSWWLVVGGQPSGGLVVRKGEDLDSPVLRSRLCTGAQLRAMEDVRGKRLHYTMVSGEGPECGWVSLESAGKVLVEPDLEGYVRIEVPRALGPFLQRIPPRKLSPASVKARQPLAISASASVPSWAVDSAEKLRARRAGELVQPPATNKPRRLADQSCFQRLPPHIALSKAQVEQMAPQNRPGFWSGQTFPHTPEQILEFGPEWLTKALRAFGTLSQDNSVSEILQVERLPDSGVDQAGGAAMKAFITVRYSRKDPSLHEHLFAKMPYEMLPSSAQVAKDTRHRISSVYGDADGSELSTYVFCEHLFPFRVPRLYFCDICRETTNYILITERVRYAPRPWLKDGKVMGRTPGRPWEVMPVCQKKMDYLLEDPVAIYGCCMRAMAQLAGWDHLGRYDEFLGPKPTYSAEEYLAFSGPRKTLPAKRQAGLRGVAESMLNQGIRFATEIAPQFFSKRASDLEMLELMKDEMMEMAPHFQDVQFFAANSSDYVAAMHPNLQPDNAYFWRDEHGDLDCGVLDWCNFARMPIAGSFMGCLTGMDADLLDEQEANMLRIFAEELRRYGGPELDHQDLLTRFRLSFLRMLMDNCQWVEKEILPALPAEEWSSVKDRFDERFVGCWSARTRGSNIINAFEFWHRRHFKDVFDEWKAGAGRPYLTTFLAE